MNTSRIVLFNKYCQTKQEKTEVATTQTILMRHGRSAQFIWEYR